jgi:hypothetical protein
MTLDLYFFGRIVWELNGKICGRLTKTLVVDDSRDVCLHEDLVGTTVLPEDQLATDVECPTNVVLGLEIRHTFALQEFLLDF